MSCSSFSESFGQRRNSDLHFEKDYSPEVDDQSISVDDFVPDMLNNNLSDRLHLLKVSKHVETQVADVVFKYIGVEGGFNQLNVQFWSIILGKAGGIDLAYLYILL